jgi:hypothetical protein
MINKYGGLGLCFPPLSCLFFAWFIIPLPFLAIKTYYKKNNMNTDMEKGKGNKTARVTRGSRNPKHGKRKHYIGHESSRSN